jgi:hypothetical protein
METAKMFQLCAQTAPSSPSGFVEFDDRGNARWVANGEAGTVEDVFQLLAVEGLAPLDE